MISGFGITEFIIVESITFGLLTKKLAFEIHEYLWIPFTVLLALHVFLPLAKKWLWQAHHGHHSAPAYEVELELLQ